jgi:hypothetical protein
MIVLPYQPLMRVKVKLSQCLTKHYATKKNNLLNKHHARKTYWGVEV